MAKLKSPVEARIQPVPNEFADEFLDVIGADFRFDHAKGLAEWIKNSADAYVTTAGVKDAEQYIVLRFKQVNPKRNSVFECIDFVGMTKSDIDKALKVWGLSDAAKKGTDLTTYGGHGNGGKFYMRQMFRQSRFITFRNGKLNVFGFDDERRYGYAAGFEDVKVSIDEALRYAQVDDLDIPQEVRLRWKRSPKAAGFTVVQGEGPERFSGKATLPRIIERLRVHPQARRLLAHKQIFYMLRGEPWGKRLVPPKVAPRVGFEEPLRIKLPRRFDYGGDSFEFRNSKYPEAYLELRTSEEPLARADLASLNGIDILGELGCIGSYRMHELGFMRYAPESEFIYGECKCPLLEDPQLRSVKNDREKLVENDLTRALLEFIRCEVESLAQTMSEQIKKDKKTRDLQASSLFNQLLDKWKNKFMARLTGEIFGGPGIGGSLGGTGGGGDFGGGGKGGSGGSKRGGEDLPDGGGGAGDQPKHGPKFPRVLLSGYDHDPLDEASTGPFDCDPRHPPVYQRDLDIEQGIYWINTARPLADKIMDQYGSNHPRWREYLFQRYVDIILKQSVHELEKRTPDMRAGDVDNLIDQVTSRVHDAAAEDLETFLFSDSLSGIAAMPTEAAEPEVSASGG